MSWAKLSPLMFFSSVADDATGVARTWCYWRHLLNVMNWNVLHVLL